MTTALTYTIETEEELNGLWIAEVIEIPGAMVYGVSAQDAICKVQALALRVLAERLEEGEEAPELLAVSFQTA